MSGEQNPDEQKPDDRRERGRLRELVEEAVGEALEECIRPLVVSPEQCVVLESETTPADEVRWVFQVHPYDAINMANQRAKGHTAIEHRLLPSLSDYVPRLVRAGMSREQVIEAVVRLVPKREEATVVVGGMLTRIRRCRDGKVFVEECVLDSEGKPGGIVRRREVVN